MKRILICSHWMEIGGAERALLGLLYSIDYSKYQVDLYLCRHSGEFMKLIPPEVNLLPEDKKAASIAISAKEAISRGCFDIVLGRLIGKIKTHQFLKYNPMGTNCVAIEYSNKYTYNMVAPINPGVTYDLLISFLEPHYIAANKASAKRKIAWMHTDYGCVGCDVKSGYQVWGAYNAIAAISEDCHKAFAGTYPLLKDKLFLLENIVHPELIRKQASEFEVEDEMPQDGSMRLLSMGRFCYAKNFDNIPDICKCLVDKGIDVKWYLIGYGGDENLIRYKIAECGMEKNVIILGKKVNPYPYIKACDIYVQPSRYEGKAVSVLEAQCLQKPVVITNYPTAASQIQDRIDGVIVPMDNQGCADGLSAVISDNSLCRKLAENLAVSDFGNQEEINKLYAQIP